VLQDFDDSFGLLACGFRNYKHRVQFDELDVESGSAVNGDKSGHR
jgi:hypothetical protein